MSDKLILVTGGAGFIGSNLCRALVQEGHRVISLDNYFTGSELERCAGVEYRTGHTKDIAALVPETPDIIFHLGEYARVEQSVLEPEVVHDLNVLGTRAVVEYWRGKKCKLVYAGSSTKFGDDGRTRETSPYASTKAANTELVKKVGDEEKLPYAITYFYNVFGPGERFGTYGTLIEIFKQQYLHGSLLTVVSPGTQRRNFTHVDDIVDGLMLVAEKGEGDEFGLGSNESYSVLEVAKLFSDDILMLPERQGNRMGSALHVEKTAQLGWRASRTLRAYVQDFLAKNPRGSAKEKRVLVFSTTFYPVAGLAEDALVQVMREMPQVQFDIVTAAFSRNAKDMQPPTQNSHIYRVGYGRPSDKYLLPILGYGMAKRLRAKHEYLFAWALMASYGALAAIVYKRFAKLPLLITLADQNISDLSSFKRFFLRRILTDADQIYGSELQEREAASVSSRKTLRNSVGEGDAIANQFRFMYASIVRRHTMRT